jgi:hypothetical protein
MNPYDTIRDSSLAEYTKPASSDGSVHGAATSSAWALLGHAATSNPTNNEHSNRAILDKPSPS